jgi:hypothetical protein
MKIEVLEDRLSSDGYTLVQGDSLQVPDDVGAKWCSKGWAKDVAGVIETGERVVLNAKLNVTGSKVVVKSPELGVK